MPFQRGGCRAGEEERFRFGLQQGNEDCYEKISASRDEKVTLSSESNVINCFKCTPGLIEFVPKGKLDSNSYSEKAN